MSDEEKTHTLKIVCCVCFRFMRSKLVTKKHYEAVSCWDSLHGYHGTVESSVPCWECESEDTPGHWKRLDGGCC